MELPEPLARRIEAQQVPLEELQTVFQVSMELWLAERDRQQPDHSQDAGRFQESAVPFVRRLIAQNRDLFEELARR